MPLQEFSRDIVPIIQAGVGLLGLVSLIFVVLQIRQTNKWNRLNFLNSFINSTSSLEIERQLTTSAKALKINLREPLTEDEVDKIFNDEDAFYAVKSLLNNLENLCFGIRVGAADPKLAYEVHSVRIKQANRILRAFIERMRSIHGDDDIYIEIERTALDYERRYQKLAAKRAREAGSRKKKHEASAPLSPPE
jgi:NhaP-type Na+/H+ and K+/H+ antiporter